MAGIGSPTMVHTPIAAYTKLSLYLALEQDGKLSRPAEVPKSRRNFKKSSKSTSTPSSTGVVSSSNLLFFFLSFLIVSIL